jgi:hypothetical protein
LLSELPDPRTLAALLLVLLFAIGPVVADPPAEVEVDVGLVVITGLDVAVDTGLAVAFAFAVAVGDEFCVCVWVWFCVCVLGVGVGVGVGVLLAKAPTGSIKPTQTETVAICKRVFFIIILQKLMNKKLKLKAKMPLVITH